MKLRLTLLAGLLTIVLNNYAQTITTGVVSSPKCAATTFNLTFTKSGTFTTGNIFTAQLSNASGSFTTPVVIGTLTSTVGGTIVATIPLNTSTGTRYRIRVISSAPLKTGTVNNSNITINALVAPSVTISSSAAVNNSICGSTNVTFTATPLNGGAGPVYSWVKNSVTVGANSNTYSASTWNDKDTVYCVMTSNAICTTNAVDTSNFILMDVANSNANSWRKRNDIFNPTINHEGAAAFSIGGKGYVCTGGGTADLWEYNPNTDQWTQKTNFPGGGRSYAVGFSIGNKGYVGLGGAIDFWEYNPANDTWLQKADFPGGSTNNSGFSIGTKGYASSGISFWEFNPLIDSWQAKAPIPDTLAVSNRFDFSIGNKGYLGGGTYPVNDFPRFESYSNKFYEYNPVTDLWVQKAGVVGLANSACFTIGDKAYVGTGIGLQGISGPSRSNNSFIEYDQSSDKWTNLENFPGEPRFSSVGFSIEGKGYLGAGYNLWGHYYEAFYNDFWEYKNIITTDSIAQAYCPGQSISIPFQTGCTYFNNGNLFTAQISDRYGNFNNALNIGTISSSASGSISGIIPNGLPSGNNYKIRVVASDPVYNGANISIKINSIVTPISISGGINIFGCAQSNLTYTVEYSSAAIYNWTVTGTGNSVISGQGTNSASFNLINPGTISVVATINNVCGITSASNSFDFVNTSPTIPVAIMKSFNPVIAADINITPYIQSKFNHTNVADTFRVRKISSEKSYLWEAPAGSVVSIVNDTTIAVVFSDNLVITNTSPKYIKVSSVTECSVSNPLLLSLRRYFDYPIGSFDTSICTGQNITIAASFDTATSIMDSDGNAYPITRIGNQIWMAKNLNVNASGSYYYADDPQNGAIYGRIYSNYDSVSPLGWHIPSMDDINVLATEIGGFDQGGKLKETGTSHWLDPNVNASDEYSFTALPGGGYGNGNINGSGTWWTTKKRIYRGYQGDLHTIIQLFSLEYSSGNINLIEIEESSYNAFSIRCLRDLPTLTYLWSNGATTRNISVNPTVSTNYYCTISDGLGFVIDTFRVSVNTTNPAAPSTIYGVTDVCPSFTSNSVSEPVRYYVRKVSNANSYTWTMPAGATLVSGQGDTTINVSFSNAFVSGVISVISVNSCGISSARSLTVYKRIAAVPSAVQKEFTPTSVIAVTSVCGLKSSIYRIRKVTYATSYNWSLNVGSNATITHVNASGLNDTAIVVDFLSGFTKDTLSVKSVTACSISTAKTVILNSVLVPPAITTISGTVTPCIGNVFTYTATATAPTTAQSSISVYRWTIPIFTTITTAAADSSSITLKYNTGFIGGNIVAKGQSACGIAGAAKTIYLQYLPPTPTSITSSTGLYNACIGSRITFTILIPALSTTQRAATVYRWTKPNNTTILRATADSLSITLQFNAGYAGGSLTVKGQTVCGATGTAKSQALTHTACPTGTKNNPITIIKDKNDDNFKVTLFPNPTTTGFSIKVFSAETTTASIKIMDVQGRLIKTLYAFPQETISFGNDFKPGVYMLEVSDGLKKKSIRAVKY